jgi:hypothetical protein
MYCEFCEAEVDTRAFGTYRSVRGWVKSRKQGGTNSVTLSNDLGGWAHGHCVDQQKASGSISWDQERMF